MSTTVTTKSCYYDRCPNQPKWSVRTEKSVLPNGEPFHLYTCDDHCEELTNDCRRAGARYLLRPLEGAQDAPSPEEPPERVLARYPMPIRVLGILCAGIMMMVLTPFVIGYYLFKALFFGWRPPKDF